MAQLFPWILPQASNFGVGVDGVFWVITAVCLAFMLGVAFFMGLFVVRYRQGTKVNRVLPHHEGIALELVWTIIPLVIAMFLFLYSTIVYFNYVRPAKDATEIFVVGKQWMWKIQHPNGRWEMNEIHVPAGKPVKLTMISEDVIHDFGIPAFRQNMDVVPGRYTSMWFTPSRVGRYHIFCAQYCGTNHAIMGGYVTVMEPDQFEKWMQTGNVSTSLASKGEKIFREQGCTGCHGPNANVRAPSLVGIYGKNQPIQIPGEEGWSADLPATTIKADYRYLHDSIMVPAKEVAAGYKPIMPSYQGRLTEEQVIQLIDYMKTLQTSNGTSNGSGAGYQPVADPSLTDEVDVQGARNADGSRAGTIIGERLPREKTGEVRSNNAIGLANMSDARTGKLYGGSPTGDMADNMDRDSIYRESFDTGKPGDPASGKLYGGSPTGDMANQRDRENIFRGAGAADNMGTIDESAGGMNNRNYRKRGGLKPYQTDNYTNSAVETYSGGLRSQVPAGGAR